MKSRTIAMLIAAGLFASPLVFAADDASGLAKSNGCMNCHDVATKKVGPAFKDVAAKYKGKADAEATLVGKLSEGKGHPAQKASKDDLSKIVKWVLAQ